jgi:hypothetical protein
MRRGLLLPSSPAIASKHPGLERIAMVPIAFQVDVWGAGFGSGQNGQGPRYRGQPEIGCGEGCEFLELLGPMTCRQAMFNAHHAPVGAFATFTLGFPGPKGGLGLGLGKPADENVFIGAERRDGRGYEALPFFASSADSARRYDVGADDTPKPGKVRALSAKRIRRDFGPGSDTWTAGDLTFSIYSAPKSVPDPSAATPSAMRRALVPAVFAALTLDNRRGKRPRKVFFGYEGSDPYYNTRRLDDVARGRLTGVGQGPVTAIVSDSPGVYSGCGFTLDQCLEPDHVENLAFGLGGVGALMAVVPAGQRRTFRFAICFYRDGVVTSGLPARYFYTSLFGSIGDVAAYALGHWAEQKQLAVEADKAVAAARLSPARHFQLSQAVRSYFGATEFLQTTAGEPLWCVNEGEYRMLNTFDLFVDHLFFELEKNPWVVRNQLDWFIRRYSYTDKVRLPGENKEYPGGISFCHDMGIGNCFARPGHSSYEKQGLTGCFSHMTHEQLVNWVCCATTYVLRTGDTKWMRHNAAVFRRCFSSLLNRDHPDRRQRDGVMSADSSRCAGGREITTYDSLDASLGQARNNLYLAVKTWAAYCGLREMFLLMGKPSEARRAGAQAGLCAETIASHLGPEGFIPAVMGEGSTSRIIPAIEGLVFPLFWNLPALTSRQGEFASLMRALGTHLRTVLRPGTCKFRDGGWKLSSNNDNSWLSKIYLCQHVAENIFGEPGDKRADAVHQGWLLDPENSYHAWSDQMVAGQARGSKYYPRGVTSWLWLGGRKRK